MKTFIVLSALLAVALASPSLITPIILARIDPSLAPIGPDGHVIDTPEVVAAKAEHAAAYRNQLERLENQEILAVGSTTTEQSDGALIGADGRVIDTPEVVLAKAQHANAQLTDKVNNANANDRNGPLLLHIASSQDIPLITLERILE